jgi:hypothetical protein
MLSCDIFIRSYAGDFAWLEYCLKSIKKYGHGFDKVHIVVPSNDAGSVPVQGTEVVHLTTDRTDGYMAQQLTKLHADEFCQAEYVLHVDSDCIFFKDFSPLDFFLDGKPIMLHEKFETIWNAITEQHLGWRDDHEYMRRLPIIYPRWMYLAFRQWMKKKHAMSVDDYVIRQNNRNFSEFNTFGQWAKRLYKDSFTWMEPKDVPKYCEQFWSWGGITPEIKEKIKIILAD